jgi:hypothetical protein
MEGSARGLDQSRGFFLVEDRWKAMVSFRIGSLGNAPSFLERLAVEVPQGVQTNCDTTRRQLAFLEQLCLVFANVSRA